MEGMIRHLGETIADDKATKAQKKLVYSMVKDGMRAAHIGTTGRRFASTPIGPTNTSVRHERKGGGEVGESGRGSSAFSGAVDIVVAVRRGEAQTNLAYASSTR